MLNNISGEILTLSKTRSGVSSAASVKASTISREEDVEHCNIAILQESSWDSSFWFLRLLFLVFGSDACQVSKNTLGTDTLKIKIMLKSV